MARKPPNRKPTLSPSRITTYLACPTKYIWTFIDSRGKWYIRAKSYYSFGLSLHAVLQRFHDSGDTGVTTTEQAVAALEESWIDAGYTDAGEMAEAMGEGREILIRQLDRNAKREAGIRTLAVEKLLSLDLGTFRLIGRIDRLDEHQDRSLEIIDYKSGRRYVTVEQVRDDLAMNCYQLMLRSMYPDRPARATIIALRYEGGAGVEPHQLPEASYAATDAELETLKNDLIVLGQEILSIDLEQRPPRRKPLCESCDFLRLCRQDPGFE